jgi:hypothetical protein
LISGLEKLAAILLTESQIVNYSALLLQEVLGYARTLQRGDLDFEPLIISVFSGLEEMTAFSVGRGHEDQPPPRYRQHGPHRNIDAVVDEGRLVLDHKSRRREAAHGLGTTTREPFESVKLSPVVFLEDGPRFQHSKGPGNFEMTPMGGPTPVRETGDVGFAPNAGPAGA